MKNFSKNNIGAIGQIFVLGLALFILLSYQYGGAVGVWSNPPAGIPRANNTEAPLNVGATTQIKSGNMGANIVSAISQMWSPEYCDEVGSNCSTAADLSSISNPVYINLSGGNSSTDNPTIINSFSAVDDPNSLWDGSSFTPTVAGMYFFYLQGHGGACDDNDDPEIQILKNGTVISNMRGRSAAASGGTDNQTLSINVITYLNGSVDSLTFYGGKGKCTALQNLQAGGFKL